MTNDKTAPEAWAGGGDAPERNVLNIGYLPLSDSASLIVAATQGFAQPYGLTLKLHRQASWSALCDRLVSGELDAAQGLYGLVYGMHLGLGTHKAPMAVLMNLNQNGQSISLSRAMLTAGVDSGPALAARARREELPRLCLAQTFPTGTHAMWLHFWLAAQGVHPLRDVETRVVPPSLMVEHLRARRIDGFCAGEPWGSHCVRQGMGFTVATSQSIWPDHPEKVLCCTRAFADRHPNAARALIMAILDASRFLDENERNRRGAARLLSSVDYVGAPLPVLQPRMLGDYDDGRGARWRDPHPLRFHGEGEVNFPWLSDALWFLTQFRRWGLLREDPDYLAVTREVQRTALYREAALGCGVAVPAGELRASTLIDGKTWNGEDPAAYARGFTLHALDGAARRPALRERH